MSRISAVDWIKAENVSSASVFQIGDSYLLNLKSRVLALQREVAVFNGKEGNFEDFPIFKRTIPEVKLEEDLTMSVKNESNFIRVGCVEILSITDSSAFQAGSNLAIGAESRRKHIRQFVRQLPPGGGR